MIDADPNARARRIIRGPEAVPIQSAVASVLALAGVTAEDLGDPTGGRKQYEFRFQGNEDFQGRRLEVARVVLYAAGTHGCIPGETGRSATADLGFSDDSFSSLEGAGEPGTLWVRSRGLYSFVEPIGELTAAETRFARVANGYRPIAVMPDDRKLIESAITSQLADPYAIYQRA